MCTNEADPTQLIERDLDDEMLVVACQGGMLQRVKELDLSMSKVSDRGLWLLEKGCPELSVLNLNHCETLGPRCGLALGKLKSLTKLSVEFCNFTLQDLQHLTRGQVELSHLVLSNSEVDDTHVSCKRDRLGSLLARWPGLTVLGLNCLRNVTDATIQEIASGCHRLESLGLNNTRVGDSALRALAAHCPNLTAVSLHATGVTDDGIVVLCRACPNLEHLYLSKTRKITDTALVAMGEFCKRLAFLDLDRSRISDEGVKALGTQCKGLQELDLDMAERVTSEGIRWLHRCDQLRILDLRGTKVDDDGVKALVDNELLAASLEELNLSSTLITDATLLRLAKADMPNLHSLYLSFTAVGLESIICFLESGKPNLSTFSCFSDDPSFTFKVYRLAERFPSVAFLALFDRDGSSEGDQESGDDEESIGGLDEDED